MELNQTLTPDECLEVPIGSIVEDGRHRAVRTYVGWIANDTRVFPPKYLSQYMPGARLVVIGEGVQPETLHHFRQRFRSVAIGRARANGVDTGPVHRVLDGCGISPYTQSLGMYVDFSDDETTHAVPEGTIAQAGTPDVWGLYTLFVKRGQEWLWLTGGHTYSEGGVIIDLPDGQAEDWYTAEWQESDPVLIAELKQEILRLGAVAKRSASWCGQYELALERMCIQIKSPDDLDMDEVEEGTVTVATPGPANQWLDANRGAFVVGDRVTRRNRPHTVRGRGDYQEASPGHPGRVIETFPQDGRIRVQWDQPNPRPPGANVRRDALSSTIDADCLMLAEQEFVVGAHVARAYGEILRYEEADCDHQAEPGDIGVVSRDHHSGTQEYVNVRWSNGHDDVYSASCLEVVRSPETTMADPEREPQVGDQVRLVRQFSYRQRTMPDWDRRFGVIGDVGNVEEVAPNHLTVTWPNGENPTFPSSVDRECVVLVEREPELAERRPFQRDDRVRLARNYTIEGRSTSRTTGRSFMEAYDIGATGRVAREIDGAGTIGVRWDPGVRCAHRTARVDAACFDLAVTEAEAEWVPAIGDRIRLATPYYVTNQERDHGRYTHLASVGAHGVIESVETYDGYPCAMVRWDHRDGTTRINTACLQPTSTAATEADNRPLEIGDRVRRLDNPYSISDMRSNPAAWDRYCSPGDEGEVMDHVQRDQLGVVRVRWFNDSMDETARTRGRRIDVSCVERVR
jgi:hypothetical protein